MKVTSWKPATKRALWIIDASRTFWIDDLEAYDPNVFFLRHIWALKHSTYKEIHSPIWEYSDGSGFNDPSRL